MSIVGDDFMLKNTYYSLKYFENRELSWLEFNQRVLDEAMNFDNPLFERIKFLSIVSSNLDEFFMVRVSSLIHQKRMKEEIKDYSGLTPKQQLKKISTRTHKMIEEQYTYYKTTILPQLKAESIELTEIRCLNDQQKKYLRTYFKNKIEPLLKPTILDKHGKMPLIINKSLNIGVALDKDNEKSFAIIQIPTELRRYIEIPQTIDNKSFILIENIIIFFLQDIFKQYSIRSLNVFRITRNGDLMIREQNDKDIINEIEESVKKRKWGAAIRLEITYGTCDDFINYLKTSLHIHNKDVYYIDGPLDLTFLMKLYNLDGFDYLKYDSFYPAIPKCLQNEDIFSVIRKNDILLHHPYESFTPVIKLMEQAALDDRVVSIKQTLYRVSGKSPIIKALSNAAKAGKEVTVLVELKARFDEQNNIKWARRLEKSGCKVIYGLVGLKTHSKLTLIERIEDNGVNRYLHLSTGNYNDITAKFYTDLGIITCNEKACSEAAQIFNTLSGYSPMPSLSKLTMAPQGLREKFINLIKREETNSKLGRKAKIIAKMNALCDPEIIQALYDASASGVKIELIVRGICCLIPGIEGVSDNITVRSIVGRYLEHSRIYYFYNDGEEEVFLSSADWMPRNLNRRVELLCHLENSQIMKRIIDILGTLLMDTAKAKIKNPNSQYVSLKKKSFNFNAQEFFLEEANKIEIEYSMK